MNTHRLVILLVIGFGLLAHASSFQGSFHFDDFPIVENYFFQNIENLPRILAGSRGLGMATFSLNYAVGGKDVFGYHLVNAAFHILNGILVYLVLLHVLSRKQIDTDCWGQRIAAFTALIFVVHPLHTQAVSYIVQRLEVMASTFYLLAILLFLLGCRSLARGKTGLLFSAVLVAYLLGWKSKEIIVTLPAALLLYDYLFVARKNFHELLRRWPIHTALGVACVWFVVKTMGILGGPARVEVLAEQGRTASAGFAVQSVTPWEYFLTQTNVIIHYLSLIIAPINQNLDYDFPIFRSLFQVPALNEGTVLNFILLPPIVAILFLVGLVVGAILLARTDSHKAHVVSFCLLMYFIVLSPTSSFIPIIDVIYEHRVYLASVFIIVPLVMALDWLGGRIFERKGKTVENRLASVLDDR